MITQQLVNNFYTKHHTVFPDYQCISNNLFKYNKMSFDRFLSIFNCFNKSDFDKDVVEIHIKSHLNLYLEQIFLFVDVIYDKFDKILGKNRKLGVSIQIPLNILEQQKLFNLYLKKQTKNIKIYLQ